jgi:hypothetical protein
LDAALEAVTRTNEALMGAGMAPTADEMLAAGMKWEPERPGDEHFDHAGTMWHRFRTEGRGSDCDDWAPAKAATLRVTGEDPGARACVYQSGPKRWHAVVERSDGSIDDPSADAGMYEYRPPVNAPMGPGRKPHIAHRVFGDAHIARVDVPMVGAGGVQLCGHGFGLTPAEAIAEAIQGASVVGDYADAISPLDAARLRAAYSILAGADPDEVAAYLEGVGDPHADAVVGSLFGKILKGAASMAPIPGAGLMANMLPDDPESLLKGGKKGKRRAAPGAAPAAAPGGGGGAPSAASPPGYIYESQPRGGFRVVRF